ncbi:hypothetical protein [Candidatus Viadribacter manganicus]|nr:hypothetical protein [Candidatus Viadribacter manganicus]
MVAWLALALVHTPPALATFSQRLRKQMYGAEGSGSLDLILVHRGVLFLAVVSVCVLAAFHSSARTAAALVTSISVLGFLSAYVTQGAPKRLRTIALADAVALLPLAIVCFDVWASLTA